MVSQKEETNFMLDNYPKFLRRAFDYSLQFDYDYELNQNLCSILVKGSNIISVGYNKAKTTNQFMEHYANVARGHNRNYYMSVHSECDAILKARNKTDLSRCKLYTIRRCHEPKLGVVGLSRSCQICETASRAYGITKSWYSIDDNHFGCMTIGSSTNQTKDKIYRCESFWDDED